MTVPNSLVVIVPVVVLVVFEYKMTKKRGDEKLKSIRPVTKIEG